MEKGYWWHNDGLLFQCNAVCNDEDWFTRKPNATKDSPGIKPNCEFCAFRKKVGKGSRKSWEKAEKGISNCNPQYFNQELKLN